MKTILPIIIIILLSCSNNDKEVKSYKIVNNDNILKNNGVFKIEADSSIYFSNPMLPYNAYKQINNEIYASLDSQNFIKIDKSKLDHIPSNYVRCISLIKDNVITCSYYYNDGYIYCLTFVL